MRSNIYESFLSVCESHFWQQSFLMIMRSGRETG
jgi:hypothetical protein